jgi:hypothetical protein
MFTLLPPNLRFHCLHRENDTRYPSAETVFEYVVDPKSRNWVSWDSKLPSAFRLPADVPPYRVLVPTVDTQRNKFIAGALVRNNMHTLLVGAVGVGKTMTLTSLLEGLPADKSYTVINFSAQTSSNSLQVTNRTGELADGSGAGLQWRMYTAGCLSHSVWYAAAPMQHHMRPHRQPATVASLIRPGVLCRMPLRASWRSAPRACLRPWAGSAWWPSLMT